jgi:putative transcriptional regulator
MEKDKYCPSLKLGFRIARIFGVGIDQVFTYEEDKDGPSSENDN